jgi:hypothetical protein
MCHHFTLLAHQTDQRFIARCEHGMIHLNWDQITMRLAPIDLLRIGNVLDQLDADMDRHLFRAGPVCLVRDEGGYVQVWIGSSCLYLTPVDVMQVADMVRIVITHYSRMPPENRREDTHPFDVYRTYQVAPARATFLLN